MNPGFSMCRRSAASWIAALAATRWPLGFFLAAVVWSGCAPPTAKDTAGQPSPANSAWAWSAYPMSDRIQLAILSSKVQAKNSLSLVAPMPGLLRLRLATPQTNLPAGVVWAELESELLAAESNELCQARVKLDQREQTLRTLELPRQRLKMTRDLWESERQEALTAWVLTNQDLAAPPSAELKNQDIRPESLALAQEEVSLLRQSLAELGKTNLAILGIDLEDQQAEWQRRQLDFEHKQALSQIKMPFSGQLTVSLPMADGVTEYPVNSGQELGVVRDLSQIQLRVPLYDPAWAALPTGALRATIQASATAELEASFSFKRVERDQFREEEAAYFQIRPDQVAAAATLVGMDVTVGLWRRLDQPARIVPKLALVLYQPAAFQRRNWAEGVAQIWPGARVVAEGQTDLAIEVAGAEQR
jgi:hypothetical protein